MAEGRGGVSIGSAPKMGHGTAGVVYDPYASGGGKPAGGPSSKAPPAIDFGGVLGGLFGGGSGGGSSKPVSRTYTSADGSWQGSDGNWYNKDGSPKGGPGKPAGGPGSIKPGAGGAGGGSPLDVTNTAQKDPRLDFLGEQVTNKIKNPTDSSKRQIDTVGLALRDLQAGQQKELGARFAQQGMSGSGAETAATQQLQSETSGKVAGAARDITLQRERDADQFLLGSTGALGAAGDAARQDRELSGRLWIENEQNQRAQEQANLARQLAVLNLLGNLGGLGAAA